MYLKINLFCIFNKFILYLVINTKLNYFMKFLNINYTLNNNAWH